MPTTLQGLGHHFDSSQPADPSDPPLRPDVDAFIANADCGSLSVHFQQWMDALAKIRIQDMQNADWQSNLHV